MPTVRTRFAPSPTGYMHVGNLRTALYAYLLARKDKDGKFILRIEDTDRERYVEGAVDIIYNTLRKAGLKWDEGPDIGGPCGPYVQSERMGMFKEYALKLVESGHAYYCFCDKDRLEELKKIQQASGMAPKYDGHCRNLTKEEIEEKLKAGVPYVIRQKMPTEGTTTFHDEVFGDITVENSVLDDQILIKTDGMPTYNFANVVDDHTMGITHVIRGNEYLSSTPKYNRIYEAFGWEIPVYVHCPLITNEDGQKLSKRSGHSSFEDLLEQGFLKDAVVNFVALLGWSPAGEKEIFSLPELVEEFDFRHISKSPAVFDMTKLRWMNGEYMKMLDEETFFTIAKKELEEALPEGTLPGGEAALRKVAEMVHTRIQVLPDIREQVDFLREMPDYDLAMYTNKKSKSTLETSREVLADVIPLLEQLDAFDNDTLFACLQTYAKEKEKKVNTVMWPLRTAVSGKQATPSGATGIMELLGKEESLRRLREALAKTEQAAG